MNTLVWETKADKIYQCEVHRVGDYKGRLTVINTVDKSTVLDTEVTLSFNAIFGPDGGDVMDWQEKSLNAIDAQ